MANPQDIYVPKYAQEQEGPGKLLALLKFIGVAAASLTAANVLGAGVADAAIAVKDYAPSSDPALSQRVGNTLRGMIGGDFNVTCEDLSSTEMRNPDTGVKKVYLYGYVSTYALPVVDNRMSGSRIHLDNIICNDINSIGYDPKNNIAPALAYPQLYGLLVGTHEMVHVEGTQNEAVAQCIALQRTAGSLALHGYNLEDQSIRDAVLSDYNRMPNQYRSPDCRVDGPLDTTPLDNALSDAWLPTR